MPTSDRPPNNPFADGGDDGFDGEFSREASILSSLAADPVELVDAPEDLWSRIQAAAAAEPQDGASNSRSIAGADAAGAVAAGDEAGGAAVVPMRRRRRAAVIIAIAAALVLIGVSVGVVVTGRTDRPTEVASATLQPYNDAPVGAAGGTVQLVDHDGRYQLRVDMHDIPAPAPGTFYEMWLIDPSTGSPVSVAAMKDGSSDVSTLIDVPEQTDPTRYDVVDVSVQDLNAGPEHSGKSVLRGTLST